MEAMMLQTTVKDTNKIEYVAVYCRTAHLDDMTIESQKSRLLNAAIQNGFSTEQILFFIDNGYSGLNLKRPGVKDLLNKLRELPIKWVYVTNESRIARSFDVIGQFINEVQTAGAKIYSIQAGNEHDLEVEFSVMKLYREKASALLKGGAEV
jgi:site-specific recombinases, DNA invertase pin homologs